MYKAEVSNFIDALQKPVPAIGLTAFVHPAPTDRAVVEVEHAITLPDKEDYVDQSDIDEHGIWEVPTVYQAPEPGLHVFFRSSTVEEKGSAVSVMLMLIAYFLRQSSLGFRRYRISKSMSSTLPPEVLKQVHQSNHRHAWSAWFLRKILDALFSKVQPGFAVTDEPMLNRDSKYERTPGVGMLKYSTDLAQHGIEINNRIGDSKIKVQGGNLTVRAEQLEYSKDLLEKSAFIHNSMSSKVLEDFQSIRKTMQFIHVQIDVQTQCGLYAQWYSENHDKKEAGDERESNANKSYTHNFWISVKREDSSTVIMQQELNGAKPPASFFYLYGMGVDPATNGVRYMLPDDQIKPPDYLYWFLIYSMHYNMHMNKISVANMFLKTGKFAEVSKMKDHSNAVWEYFYKNGLFCTHGAFDYKGHKMSMSLWTEKRKYDAMEMRRRLIKHYQKKYMPIKVQESKFSYNDRLYINNYTDTTDMMISDPRAVQLGSQFTRYGDIPVQKVEASWQYASPATRTRFAGRGRRNVQPIRPSEYRGEHRGDRPQDMPGRRYERRRGVGERVVTDDPRAFFKRADTSSSDSSDDSDVDSDDDVPLTENDRVKVYHELKRMGCDVEGVIDSLKTRNVFLEGDEDEEIMPETDLASTYSALNHKHKMDLVDDHKHSNKFFHSWKQFGEAFHFMRIDAQNQIIKKVEQEEHIKDFHKHRELMAMSYWPFKGVFRAFLRRFPGQLPAWREIWDAKFEKLAERYPRGDLWVPIEIPAKQPKETRMFWHQDFYSPYTEFTPKARTALKVIEEKSPAATWPVAACSMFYDIAFETYEEEYRKLKGIEVQKDGILGLDEDIYNSFADCVVSFIGAILLANVAITVKYFHYLASEFVESVVSEHIEELVDHGGKVGGAILMYLDEVTQGLPDLSDYPLPVHGRVPDEIYLPSQDEVKMYDWNWNEDFHAVRERVQEYFNERRG